jgi:hypothetical protein
MCSLPGLLLFLIYFSNFQMEVLGICGRSRRPTGNEKDPRDGSNQQFPHALSFMFMKRITMKADY